MLSAEISDWCLLCGRERETVDHLFLLHCTFSSYLWCFFLRKCDVLQCSSIPLLGMSPFFGCGVGAMEVHSFSCFVVHLEEEER